MLNAKVNVLTVNENNFFIAGVRTTYPVMSLV